MNEIGLSCIGDWCEMDRPNWSCQQSLHYNPRPFSQNLIVISVLGSSFGLGIIFLKSSCCYNGFILD